MRFGFALAALAGVVATVFLIVHEGAGGVADSLARLGWWLALVAAFHVVPLLLSAAAWRRAMTPRHRRSLAAFLAFRWIREGVNNLLPVAQVGGDVVGARLLTVPGVPPPTAAASVIVDFTVELVTLGLFILLGLALLSAGNRWTSVDGWAVAGVAVLVAAGLGFAAAQRAGLFRTIERLLDRLAATSARFHFPSVRGLHDAVMARYADRRSIAGAVALHLLSWLIATGEIWLVLHFMGAAIDLREALVIESLSHAVRSAGFFVPGALGVQEAGFVALGALFGVAPDAALALALARRAREVALGAPALLAWQAIEARRLWHRRRPAPDRSHP